MKSCLIRSWTRVRLPLSSRRTVLVAGARDWHPSLFPFHSDLVVASSKLLSYGTMQDSSDETLGAAPLNTNTTLLWWNVQLPPSPIKPTTTSCTVNVRLVELSDDKSSEMTKKDGHSNTNVQESENVPESVLQYERQLRKSQHARKAGQPVLPNDLKVIYVDNDIVVVNKPPGVLAVPGVHSRDSILKLVYETYGGASSPNLQMEHMIVHRLDMDTSGIIIFGRSLEVTKQLHEQFRDRKVDKEYECLVQGTFPGFALPGECSSNVSFEVNLPLQRDHAHPPFMRVSTPESEAEAAQVLKGLHKRGWTKLTRKRPKPSQTRIRVVEHGSRTVSTTSDDANGGNDGIQTQYMNNQLAYTRLRLVPITGRTHQLRVHCAALGFPIVGDPSYSLYGEASPGGGIGSIPSYFNSLPFEDDAFGLFCTESIIHANKVPSCPFDLQLAWTKAHPPNDQPMCLHAAMLQITHPTTGKVIRWEVPPEF